ncbi:hypothetical protein DSO57_1014064 [Entomophthora muscae]|uniref:Uncharacterized protein n=1 Tax=Entomophthora muscae TaxID=34485 RepID=A0ACC2TGE7_9FUNG|nr:hypothetical protein DSO57_1014064 [Entomophthora muscae]
MTSYFEEHGVSEKPKATSQLSTDQTYEDFLGLGAQSGDTANNDFVLLANTYARILNQRGMSDDSQQQELIDNLVTQLLEEANESAKGPPPASKAFIKNLPKIDLLSLDQDSYCSICKDSFASISDNDPVVKLPCGHHFDSECLLPWLKLHNTCPVCRHEVPSDDPEWLKKKHEAEMTLNRDWMYG